MSKRKSECIRKCVATGKRLQKEALIRVVRVGDAAMIDPTGRCPGRGAYIIPDAEIIKKAKKKNAFTKALRMKVDVEIYDELLKIVGDLN